MKIKNFNLAKQLLCMVFIIFIIILIALGYLLPRVLLPVYENNLYTILKQQSMLHKEEYYNENNSTDIAFIYVNSDGTIVSSTNLSTILSLPTNSLVEKIVKEEGNFVYLGKMYYYVSTNVGKVKRIALANDSYIDNIKKGIFDRISPIIFSTMLIISGLVLIWSQLLIKKIERLKDKVDNINNDKYNKKFNYIFEDELLSLSNAIDDMKETLKTQEEYKNQMYQNISHDFKTPLTVMKSYIEGIEDGIQDPDEGKRIIKEQIIKLEQKVHSLLYLNKINYLKDQHNFKNEITDVSLVIKESVEKFKLQNPSINWEITMSESNNDFNGSFDMWEAVIDNLLNNFVRYTESVIKITLKNNKIILYNDGPNIDINILNDIFTPYKKGIKGEFGLGLSIVKKTVSLIGYEITVKNEKKGVTFMIR